MSAIWSAPLWQARAAEAQALIAQLARIKEMTRTSVEVKSHQIPVICILELATMFHYNAFIFYIRLSNEKSQVSTEVKHSH